MGSSSKGGCEPERYPLRLSTLTGQATSPWQSSFKNGVESGKSTSRPSCKALAKNTPAKQTERDMNEFESPPSSMKIDSKLIKNRLKN